jgi:uncharacterized protein Yka (UPF0111/DUF47 family)
MADQSDSFLQALIGGKTMKPLSDSLSTITQANIEVARSLISILKELKQKGNDTEAETLQKDIQSLLQNNDQLIEAARRALKNGN